MNKIGSRYAHSTPEILTKLPIDIVKYILRFLSPAEKYPLRFVNKKFSQLEKRSAFKIKPSAIYEPGIKTGSIAFLRWVMGQKVSMNSSVFNIAARSGHLQILRALE